MGSEQEYRREMLENLIRIDTPWTEQNDHEYDNFKSN
jgi:hypothetical protein